MQNNFQTPAFPNAPADQYQSKQSVTGGIQMPSLNLTGGPQAKPMNITGMSNPSKPSTPFKMPQIENPFTIPKAQAAAPKSNKAMTADQLTQTRNGINGKPYVSDDTLAEHLAKLDPTGFGTTWSRVKKDQPVFQDSNGVDIPYATAALNNYVLGAYDAYVPVKQQRGFKLSDVTNDIQSTPNGGLWEDLKMRNQAAFGSDTGLIESALNPSRTSQTDSAAGRMARGEQGFLQTAYDIAGQGAGAINDVIGAGVGEVAKGADWLSGDLLSKGAEAVAESEVGQAVGSAAGGIAEQYAKFKEAFPDAARNLENTVNIASLIPLAKPAAGAMGVTKGVAKKVVPGSIQRRLPSYFDDIAKQGVPEKTIVGALQDSSASSILEGAQAEKAAVSLRERIAGVRPDIKKRIAGKQPQLKEYFDIAHARNLDDTIQTPLEYGARNVEKARDGLQKVMNDTGGKIGQFRQKIATVQASADDMNLVEKSFTQSLDGLNLSVKNGKVARLPGKVAGKVSDSEVKMLQGIYDDILRTKAAPASQNLIDLRNAVQDKVNFAKTAKEASNVVDPVARKVRGTIRDINLKMVGKEQGQLLDDYSDLAGILDDMNSFVDSKTGGEFLLKRVLSERGRVPREIMKKVADYTGIDLMDDATMAQLATEIIGNPAQKGLFRQEITKAGLDAMDVIDVISGAPGGTIRSGLKLLEKASGKIAPAEKMFLKAAQ